MPSEAGLPRACANRSAGMKGLVGSPLPGQLETPRAEPPHWQLAVLKCFHPSPKAKVCGESPVPPLLTSLPRLGMLWCRSTCIIVVVVVVLVIGLDTGWEKEKKKKALVKLLSSFFSSLAASSLCWDWEGCIGTKRKERLCDMERQRTVGVGEGWGGDSQGDRKDGRKVKDWGKQMCICV